MNIKAVSVMRVRTDASWTTPGRRRDKAMPDLPMPIVENSTMARAARHSPMPRVKTRGLVGFT
jgi:hypothetical protein